MSGLRVALCNPPWRFDGSVYFGCREPHLPLELGYARALLQAAGHQARLFDAQLSGWDLARLGEEVAAFGPDLVVVTTAPSYLFWRCAPPELRVPRQTVLNLRRALGAGDPEAGRKRCLWVAVGPHASTTPRATLRKLDVDVVVMGECEDLLVRLAAAAAAPADLGRVPSIAYREGLMPDGPVRVQDGPHATDLGALPALRWEPAEVARHQHHHHRFDRPPQGPGAEIEASRGCPDHCTFCAKDNFRDDLRKRPLPVVLDELDGLLALGATYVYFIDEVFLPDRALMRALAERRVPFGVQLRIDRWTPEQLALLGRAGCVSIEAGVESISARGRAELAKRCRLSTQELTLRLVEAKRHVPFVQANLIDSAHDNPGEVEAWRQHLRGLGIWASEPVPLFPYPGSPGYLKRWGPADDLAWERAHAAYLAELRRLSDLQDRQPRTLAELETEAEEDAGAQRRTEVTP